MSGGKQFDQSVKLLLIGDSGVGKTCLMLRYAQGTFCDTFITTVGIDYKYKFVDIDGKRVRLEIWDTAGQERFKAITRSYLRGAEGILCVYDVTDEQSFIHVDNWMSQISRDAGKDVSIVLVGNKCDLPDDKRKVPKSKGEDLAQQANGGNGVAFYECSAKREINVDTAFEDLARQVLLNKKKTPDQPKPQQPNINNGEKKKGCC